jgi:hypothetical protein
MAVLLGFKSPETPEGLATLLAEKGDAEKEDPDQSEPVTPTDPTCPG